MPELPEVEMAAALARRVATGRTITSVLVRHRAQRRSLPPRDARALRGARVTAVERRGKAQLFRLSDGRALLVHFRMTGDWLHPVPRRLPATARLVFTFDDGSRLALDDPRALSVISLCDGPPASRAGPDAIAPELSPTYLAAALARRRIPIKVALLDQSIVAGIGNIYASEALWRSRIDPRTPSNRLEPPRVRALVRAIRATMASALKYQERYYGREAREPANRFAVYDREGKRCRRCGSTISRIVQAGRSSYFCRSCQKR